MGAYLPHLLSFLAVVALVLAALWINSYVGVSKFLAPAGSTTI
jgi:hypothetical protein